MTATEEAASDEAKENELAGSEEAITVDGGSEVMLMDKASEKADDKGARELVMAGVVKRPVTNELEHVKNRHHTSNIPVPLVVILSIRWQLKRFSGE